MESMTGFGLGRADSPLGTITVEIRAVNHRFLDLQVRLAPDLQPLEQTLRAEVQRRVPRGKVTVHVQFTPAPGSAGRFAIDEAWLSVLEARCRAYDPGRAPNIELLLAVPGVVGPPGDTGREEQLGGLLTSALAGALDALAAERAREGAALAAALAGIRTAMADRLALIEQARGQVVARYRQRLHERIEELLGPRSAALDPGRLEQEVALFADKADISEETVRLAAHLEQLGALINSPGPVGKQLEFLIQEIGRETNTIGSKCRDLDITRAVLDLKNLAENLKEQAANIV